MGWVDPDVLEARIRRLDSDGLAAFVDDLWTARGFETTRNEAHVVARRDGTKRVLHVLTGSATTPVEATRSVDIVVAAGRPRAGAALAAELDARLRDAADLTGMLRYAIGRDAAADLCETHLGAAPDELTFPPRARVRRAVDGVALETVAATVVVALLVAVGAGAGLGFAGSAIGGSGTTDDAAVSGETVTNGGSDDPTTATAEGGSTATAAGRADSVPVAGVSETGIRNASRLARAHAAAVSETTSYTIWFDHYTPADGSGQVQYDVDVRVQDERSSVQTSREGPEGDTRLLETVYFDGTDRYVAADEIVNFSRVDDHPPTATPRAVPFMRPAEMVRTYLATTESTVSAAGERYRLTGTGRPAALPDTVADYEMTALVDERGFVRTFEAEFSVSRDGVGGRERVRLTWSYDRVNTTEVRIETDP